MKPLWFSCFGMATKVMRLSPFARWRAGLVFAILYFLFGKLGMFFASDGGQASALFPAAGLALAAVLRYGRGMAFWVFLGTLGINFPGLEASPASIYAKLALDYGVAASSTLQALVGSMLVRRLIGSPLALDSDREVLRFVVVAMLACLVSASLSIPLLLRLKLLSPGDAAFAWLTWWMGDTLGVILFTPLVLAFIGEPSSLWRARRRQLSFVVGCGLLLIALVVRQVSFWEREQSLGEFRLLSQHIGDQLLTQLSEQEAFVEKAAAMMAGRNPIAPDEFTRIARVYLKHYPGTVQAVEWAPWVDGTRRKAFERTQQGSHTGFVLTERDAAGKLVPAAARSVYVPVSYLEPLAGNESALGYDLYSDPLRRATIDLAITSQNAVATPPLTLVQERGSQQGMLLMQRVKEGASGAGLMLSVLRMGNFVKSVVADDERLVMVRLVDVAAQPGTLYDGFGEPVKAGVLLRTLNIGQRSYQLQTSPTEAYLRAHHSWQSWGLLVGGLGFMATLSLSLLLASGRTTRVERLVAERTAELAKSRKATDMANELLREAVDSIAQGFTIYDENDCLVLCNDAYLRFYGASRELIVPGASFEEVIRRGAERGQYAAATGRIDEWAMLRAEQHKNARGEVVEEKLTDGRCLMIVENRTPRGYIVGSFVDITAVKDAVEAFRERTRYLRATIDNLPFCFWLKDAGGRFLSVNKMLAHACGRDSPSDVVGRTDFEVWPKDLAARYRADDLEVMAARKDKAVEEPVDENGQRGWVEKFVRPVIAGDGRVLGTVGFSRDISARKRMEQALVESEQRWTLAVSGTNDGIWDWDLKTGKVFFSARWCALLGYKDGEISASFQEFRSRIHADDAERVYRDLTRHFLSETEFFQSEFRMRCKDGSYKWILSRGRALLDSNQQPIRITGSNSDTTQRHMAEARLIDHTEQLNAIFSLSPDGFISFDQTHRVKYISPAFLQMTGLEESALIGLDEKAFADVLARQCQPAAPFQTLVERVLNLPEDEDKNARQLIELAFPISRVLEVGLRRSGSETVSQILYFRDVTHETEVDRMKSEFLSTAAHELRTPMASIYGFAEILLMQELDEDSRREVLTTIYRQSELMASIINELLDLVRIESRQGKDFVFEALDLAEVVHVVLSDYKPPLGRELPCWAPDGPLPRVWGDSKKLQQALSNLISNAYKYSPGGGEVSVEYRIESRDEPALVGVEIRDHGIGMTPAQLARVFERFYRADASGKIPGTGLGMSIVKEIVDIHRGRVELESSLGQGTGVTLWLPRAAPTI